MPSQALVAGATYIFQNWSDGVTTPTRTINLTTDASLTANYVTFHTLSITSHPSGIPVAITGFGSVQTPYSAQLAQGSYTVTMPTSITIAGANYAFQAWSDGTTSPTKTVNLTADINLQANYTLVIPNNNLTVQSSPVAVVCTIDGAMATTPITESLVDGPHTIAVPATVTSGGQPYNFSHWENGATNPARTINLSTDTTIIATYILGTFVLQVSSTGLAGIPFTINGQSFTTPFSQALPPGTYNIAMPGSVTLLSPSTTFGTWDFQAWGDGVSASSRTVNLSTNTSLTANYLSLKSWNPNVPYNPVRQTIEQIIGSQASSLGGATLAGGWPWPLNPNGTDPSFDIKRNFHAPGSVLSLAGILGPTFVEIDNVVCAAFQHSPTTAPTTEDAGTHYTQINGGSLFPPNLTPTGDETSTTWGDTTVNLQTNGLPYPVGATCSPTDNRTCLHVIHNEIDRDWKASGRAGPANNCDWLAFLNLPPITFQNKPIDVQGFVYWDDQHVTEQYHSFSGWEIHPLTAWRLH